jgi:hypothetical protein
MVKVLGRDTINRMTGGYGGTTGRTGGGGGGGSSYTLPLAADGVRGGVQVGYTTDASARKYAVQLDNEKMYVNVPWTAVSFGTQAADYVPITIGSTTKNVLTSHQSLSGYATESWVTGKGYITSSGSCAYATSAGSAGYASNAGNADTVDNYHASELWRSNGGVWNPQANIEMHANANGCEWSFDMHRGNYTGCIWHVWDEANGSILVVDGATARVGIGTTSPSYKLHVAGTIYATGSITERSDIRCKDVETYQWAPTLDMIADAPIIRYTMKDDKMHRMRVGSVAQYWEKVMPETVSKDNEGILSIAQGDICMVNIIAMAREVRKLREEIIQLKNGRS